jgi:hypothetical protein
MDGNVARQVIKADSHRRSSATFSSHPSLFGLAIA